MFDRHLAICADCRNYLDSYKRTIDLAKSAHAGPVIEPVSEDFVKSILAARRRP